jgi:hypothetical protein
MVKDIIRNHMDLGVVTQQVIPALGRRLRQGNPEFEVSLGYIQVADQPELNTETLSQKKSYGRAGDYIHGRIYKAPDSTTPTKKERL